MVVRCLNPNISLLNITIDPNVCLFCALVFDCVCVSFVLDSSFSVWTPELLTPLHDSWNRHCWSNSDVCWSNPNFGYASSEIERFDLFVEAHTPNVSCSNPNIWLANRSFGDQISFVGGQIPWLVFCWLVACLKFAW